MKILSALLVIVILFGCREKAQESTQQGNFTVEFLFEKDGCKMYRFVDGTTRTVYWANCEGKIQSDYSTQAGKTSTTHHAETITTKK